MAVKLPVPVRLDSYSSIVHAVSLDNEASRGRESLPATIDQAITRPVRTFTKLSASELQPMRSERQQSERSKVRNVAHQVKNVHQSTDKKLFSKCDLNQQENMAVDAPSLAAGIQMTRDIMVNRLSDGSVPVALVEHAILDASRSTQLKQQKVILVEPKYSSGLTQALPLISGLLPGDMLVKVNGSPVDILDCNEIWKLVISSIDASGEVHLTVCPLRELSEFSVRSDGSGHSIAVYEHIASTRSLKRTASLRHIPQDLEEDGETCNDDDERRAWLVQKTGIAPVVKRKISLPNSLPQGRCQVKLLNSGSWFDVDETDVFEANAARYDRVEDISMLHHINEPSILHTLRERYASNLIHTFAGKRTLLVVRPRQRLAIYSEMVMDLFHDCKPEDMPPHVFSIAQSAYDALKSTRRDQAIVLLGYSNSGKTTNVRHLLNYFQHATSPSPQNRQAITVQHMNSMFTVVKSFFECQTLINASGTRSSHTFKLHFDAHSTYFVGLTLEVLTVDRTRLIHRPEAEPTFHVFYQMLAGIDSSLRKTLFLEKLTEPNLFMTPLQNTDDQQRATRSWGKLVHAMSVLGFSSDEVNAICSTLAAIYHLGVAGVVKDAESKTYQFARPAAATRAAAVLGSTVKTLSDAVFGGLTNGLALTGLDMVESFVSSLYSNVIHVITALINRKFSRIPPANSPASPADTPLVYVTIVDLPGMQKPAAYGRTTGASLEDLCQNYTVERLQQIYYSAVVTSTIKLYHEENVDCDTTELDGSKSDLFDMVGFLDSQIRSPTRAGFAGSTKNCLVNRVGLMLQLEDASNCGTDGDECLTSYLQQFGNNKKYEKSVEYVAESGRLDLGHLQCSCRVQYNVTGWTKMLHCVDTKLLLCTSSRKEVSGLFKYLSPTGQCDASVKRQPICSKLKTTVGQFTNDLRRSNLHFIHCYLPCHLTEDFEHADQSTLQSAARQHLELCIPVLRDQLRGSQALVAARLHKLGFPEHMTHEEFLHHFDNLWPPGKRPVHPVVNKKLAVEQLLDCLNVNPRDFKLGLSQVFFRSSAFALLEENRDVTIGSCILRLQTMMRGCLSRRRLQLRKYQLEAIECIQCNVRAMWSVRQWSWWRLFAKLQPVLECNIHPVDVVDAANGSPFVSSMDRKQRKLQAEVERLNELARVSRTRHEKLMSEKEKIDAEKHATQLQLQAINEDWKAEFEKARLLEDQLNELSATSRNSDVVKGLKNSKAELERKYEEAELQLEEQLETISQLEQAKSRLESAQEKNRSRYTKEQKAMELEIEQIKETYQKKLRGIELQLEDEVSEKENILKEKRDLEKKLNYVQQQPPHDEEMVQQLKKKIRKAAVVIADKQTACEQHQQTSTVAARLAKQARVEVDDIQTTNAATLRAKKVLESELESLQQQLESALKSKLEAEDRCKRLASQNTDLQSQLTINEDEIADIMKKYKALVQQNAVDLKTIQQQSSLVQDLQARLQKQKTDVEALQLRIRFHQESSVSKETALQLEARIRELESRCNLEATSKVRAEKLLERSKARQNATSSDQQRLSEEAADCRNEGKELTTRLREIQVQLRNIQIHDTETTMRNQQLEKRLKSVEARGIELSEDLELSNRRVIDLQKALNSCISNQLQQPQVDDSTDSEEIDNGVVENDVDSEGDSNYDSLNHQLVRHAKKNSSLSSSSSSTSSFRFNFGSSSASASNWMASAASPRRTWLQDSQI